MGNSVSGSKDRHIDESVDFGSLAPQGVYTASQDWNQQVVGNLIVDRKLAPFYRPLEEYDDSWDDDHILASRKEIPNVQIQPPPDPPASASSTASKFHHHKHPNKSGKEPFRPTEASVYRGAVECPICFLYYPPNINRSRCCDQAICTECFVQIKRTEPTTTHLVSEPASCPYCVQDNFGVTYEPPSWRTGLVRDGQPPSTPTRPNIQKVNSVSSADSGGSGRRKSFSADSPEVVTIDQIRPDWEAKLAAVRAAVTRRANRRIIMRQVGDRLIPIGVTSGRVIADSGDGTPANGEGAEGGTGRRSRRRVHGGQELNQILGSVGLGGLGGQDLEELMVMEAMRLSLLEHEDAQRRQNNNDGNNDGLNNAATGASNGNGASPASSSSPSPRHSSSSPALAPRTPSPASTPSNTPSHQSPPRSRFFMTPSPLGNADTSFSDSTPGSAPPSVPSHPTSTATDTTADTAFRPSPGRTHRRTGSNPGPPSGSTLAAAYGAVQSASTFLNPGGRHGQGVPRSAPATRAASPSPSLSPIQSHGGITVPVPEPKPEPEPDAGEDTLQRDPPVVIEPKAEDDPAAAAEVTVSVSSTSRVTPDTSSPAPALATATHDLTASPSPLPTPPGSDIGDDALSQGYKPLQSSTESAAGDPLLGWDK